MDTTINQENVDLDGVKIKNNFKTHLEFLNIGRKVRPLFEVLNRQPNNDFEKRILLSPKISECGNETTVEDLQNAEALYNDLKTSYEDSKQVVTSLWQKVQNSWNELQEHEEPGLGYSNAHQEIIHALQNLNDQYDKRREDKTKKLESFIVELRSEIMNIWDQCMLCEEDRETFEEFKSTDYSENILEVHKRELQKWTLYLEKSQIILEKVKKREAMWDKLQELDARADDPNRFINRGGALLKDQNMHNYITKALPKLDAELIKLDDAFEKEHGKRVKIHGKSIQTIIDESWAEQKEKRAAKIRAKKTRQTMTPLNNQRIAEKRKGVTPSVISTPAIKRPKPEKN